MKKTLLIVIALALVLTLALTLAACGGSTEQNPDSGTPSTPDGVQTPDEGDQGETPDGGEDDREPATPPVTYTVTFETNGGNAVQPVTVDEGTAIAAAPETTLEGYEFGGWYFSADLSDDALVTFPYTPAGSTTLYAKWSKILTAADLYNEVFGEDYEFISFSDMLPTMLEATTQNYFSNEKLLFANVNDSIVLYFDAINSINRQVLCRSTYKGDNRLQLLDYATLSEQIKSAGNFQKFILINVNESNLIENKDVEIANLQALKSEIENYKNVVRGLAISDFSGTVIINNTKTDIEFADFAAKFMPAGVTPIACYVGACGARNIDASGYFNTGYCCMVDIALVYESTNGTIAVSQHTFIVKALNNQEASESIYNRLLNGNETTDYIVSNVDTTTIENPIWTGYTVGVTK